MSAPAAGSDEVRVHRYPAGALTSDYLRAGIGLALTGAPLAVADPAPLVLYILVGLAVLFLSFAVRTGLRHAHRIEASGDGLRVLGPFGRAFAWDDLRAVRMRYYSTKRDRSGGWMELELKGRGRAIRADSALTDFADLAGRAAAEAVARGIEMSARSKANFVALGVWPETREGDPKAETPAGS